MKKFAGLRKRPLLDRLVLILMIALLAVTYVQRDRRKEQQAAPAAVSYARVATEVADRPKAVKQVTVIQGEAVRVEFANRKAKDIQARYTDDRTLSALVKQALAAKITVKAEEPAGQSVISQAFNTLAYPVIMLGGMFLLLSKVGAGGMLGGGGKRFDARNPEDLKVRFADVAGVEGAKNELMETVEFLRAPKRFHDLGAIAPKGVLLVGPPGTGKTLLAKAVAGEAGAAFFSVSGSDFVELFAGMGAKRVRGLFAAARKAAAETGHGAIIFIDEIDAVAKARGSRVNMGNDEREQTLNQLLVEMDGFTEGEAIVVIAASNRPDHLDKALLRPGRFDRQVTVEAPDVKGRREILAIHAKGKPISDDVLDKAAKQTPGFTGADLANLLNEAAIEASRRKADCIDESCIAAATDRVLAGPERRTLTMSEHEREVIAYHEVGHALTAHFADNPTPVQRITVVARGRALGYTFSVPETDRVLETRESLMDQLTMLMGGRAAEIVKFNRATSGCSNDLERATKIATNMITKYGMSGTIGLRSVFGADETYTGASTGGLVASERMLSQIDREVSGIIAEAEDRAIGVIMERKAELERVTVALRERETLHSDEFLALLNDPAADTAQTAS